MYKKSTAIVAILLMIALVTIPAASAGHVNGNVRNVAPVMGIHDTAGLMPGVFVAGNGILATSHDKFILNDLGVSYVEFYSVTGDWNGYDDIIEFSYEITDSDSNTVDSGDMAGVLPELTLPFQIGTTDYLFDTAGIYTISVYVEDQNGLSTSGELQFTIYASPEYVISDLVIADITPGEENCYEFTVSNERGEAGAYIENIMFADITGNGMNIPASLISYEIVGENDLGIGNTVTVEVCIDLTSEMVAVAELDGFEVLVNADSATSGDWIIQIGAGAV